MNNDNPKASAIATSKSRQFDLRILLLLVAAIASFFAASRAFRETVSTKKEIAQLRSLDKSLQVRDKSQYALVYQDPIWEGERRCRVYLPSNNRYRLYIALESKYQKSPPGGATPVKTVDFGPGEHVIRHFIYTAADGLTRISVHCDGELIYDKVQVGWLPHNYAYVEKTDEPQQTVQQEHCTSGFGPKQSTISSSRFRSQISFGTAPTRLLS